MIRPGMDEEQDTARLNSCRAVARGCNEFGLGGRVIEGGHTGRRAESPVRSLMSCSPLT